MRRWVVIGWIFAAVLFAVGASWRVDALDLRALRALGAALLVAGFVAACAFGRTERGHRLSLGRRMWLGAGTCVLLAAILGAGPGGLVVAVPVGALLGFHSDTWARLVPLR
jgi:hypothetical protein